MLTNSSTHSSVWPCPDINIDTAIVMDLALVDLADRRFMRTLDAPTQLHLLASLIAQAESWVSELVVIARTDGATWAEVGRLLGTTATAARKRAPNRAGAPAGPSGGQGDDAVTQQSTSATRGRTSPASSTPRRPQPRRQHGHNLRAPLAD